MELFEKIRKLRKEVDKLFVYGTSLYGRNLFHVLEEHEIDIDRFVNSNI